MKKRLKVKVTTVRQQTVVSVREALRLSCPICGRDVEALNARQAIGILEVSHEALDRLIAARQVHAIRTITGSVWVCRDSLFEDKIASARSG